MLHQRTRDIYFTFIRHLNKLISSYYKRKYRDTINPALLHLGCGRFYFDEFINVDGNFFRKNDVWLDMRNKFPFNDNSIDAIYCCHVLEHFYPDELEHVLFECFRVLKPGSGIRVVVPDLKLCVNKYIENDENWFTEFPRSYCSIGGKLCNILLSDGAHRLVFDFSHLGEVLQKAGFVNILQVKPGESQIFSHDQMKNVLKEEQKDVVKYSLYTESFTPNS